MTIGWTRTDSLLYSMNKNPRSVRLPYSTQWLTAEDFAAVEAIMRGKWLTTGPAVDAFESALANRARVSDAAVLNSGTSALHAAYAAAGLGPDDEIITSPLTFVATASCALMLGATVRFADIEPDTGTLDASAAAEQVRPRTRIVVPVDYAGHPADYAAFEELCEARELLVIADAAHSFGASFEGRPVGSLADATTLSFHPVKAITTAEGGAVLTDNAEIARRVREFRSHGIVRDPSDHRHKGPGWYYEVQSLGFNYRMPDLLCALGESQLGKLDSYIQRRRAVAARYTEALGAEETLELPTERENVRSSWHLYVVRVRDAARRDEFLSYLQSRGLGAQVHYLPVYRHPLFADLGYRPGGCPVAENFSARAVSIPLFPRMSDADVEYVVDVVLEGCRTTL